MTYIDVYSGYDYSILADSCIQTGWECVLMVRNPAVTETSHDVMSSSLTFCWLNCAATHAKVVHLSDGASGVYYYLFLAYCHSNIELGWDGFLNTNHNVDTESLIIDLFFFSFTLIQCLLLLSAQCHLVWKGLTNCTRVKKAVCIILIWC